MGIIGIVAAMTIPTLQNNSAKTQYVTSLKKAYTVLNQALISLANDMGCPGDLKCTGLFTGTDRVVVAKNFSQEFIKYLKIIKNCETSSSGCMTDSFSAYFDGRERSTLDNEYDYAFIMADNIAVAVSLYRHYNSEELQVDCRAYYWVSPLTQVCAFITIDVNGPQKGPNIMGRDLFYFLITNAKGPLLYPQGLMTGPMNWAQEKSCSPESAIKNGQGCAGRIMEEGWQMNY